MTRILLFYSIDFLEPKQSMKLATGYDDVSGMDWMPDLLWHCFDFASYCCPEEVEQLSYWIPGVQFCLNWKKKKRHKNRDFDLFAAAVVVFPDRQAERKTFQRVLFFFFF